MMRKKLAILGLIVFWNCATQGPEKPLYHKTRRGTVVDSYFGTQVVDPYRWLEDDTAAETADWVQAQNEATFGYLEKIPFRERIEQRLEEVWNYPKYSAPFREGGKYYFYKNDGLQNQSVLYVQDDLEGEPRVVLDPNSFSEDGTVALSGIYFSPQARYLGYSKSTAGSDWREFYVLDLERHQDLGDHLEWIKFSGMAWSGEGFYYTRYPRPGEGEELSAANENSKIYFHRLGTGQSEDELIFEDPAHPRISNYAGTTEDEHFLILYRSKGTHGVALKVRDLSLPGSAFMDLITDYEDEHSVVDNIGDRLLLLTNRKAPRWRLVLVDPTRPEEEHWETVIPENEHVLQSVSSVGGVLIARYMEDVTTRVYVYSQKGVRGTKIELPALGLASGFGGKREDRETFYSFQSFAYPPTIYRYDLDTGVSTEFRRAEVDFNSADYQTEQVFYTSVDGTRVPMFIVHKKGLRRDGRNPTLLYGYGGFNISRNPSFSISNTFLLENGGVYAQANLRGGGEYGENWHRAGMLLSKQNVFDDFIAAGEYLIEKGYTSSKQLAIMGRSNGGLLIGAVINQRPDLCAVAFPGVGVMDMLRYHKFTIGWAWAVEYGSSDEQEHFPNLYSYSPLHNIRSDTEYPAVLITTADHDDRVVPAHSFKYAATLQAKAPDNKAPLLIRIETKAGHGAGKPTSKIIEEQTDIWAFMFYNLGLRL